jgi:hypothetical protein
MQQFLSYRFVRLPVAAVILFAVLTKAYQVATEPSDGVPWLAMGHVLCESGLALLLLSGVYPRWIKWASIIVFSVFFCVAVDLALKSAVSCGCFGNVHLDPRITACLDASIILILLFSSVESRREHPTRKQIVLVVSGIVLASFLLIPMSLHSPVQRFDHGMVVSETMIEPESSDAVLEVEPPSGLVPSNFHIGHVEPKSVHRLAIEIINPTNETWSLNAVETECECLVVAEKPESLTPGKSHLVIEFTTPDIIGYYSKTITVISGEQQWTMRFHARIDTPLSVEPEVLIFAPDETEKMFTIRNDGKVPIRLLYATSPSNTCIVSVGVEAIAPGDSISLMASRNGTFSAEEQTISIHTNYSRQKIVLVPYRGR